MAEFGAHVTSAVGGKPTIFEVLAQQSLEDGLRSGFRYLFKVLAENNPVKFTAIYRNFEELYTLLDFVVQYLHLKTHGASFAESFYGLKRTLVGERCKAQKHDGQRWLPQEYFIRSLLFLVLFPYLRTQLQSFYSRLKDKELTGELETIQEKKRKVAKLYLKLFPYIHFCWEFSNLCYQVAYAVGRSHYHTPILHLCSIQLRTLTNDDVELLERNTTVLPHNIRWHNFPYHILRIGIRSLAAGLTVGLSTGAFFLQFLDWWYSQDSSPSSLVLFPIPPPPKKWPVNFHLDICPICHKKRINETVLSSSGFVFCYRCIFIYIKNHSRCPVTGYASTVENLIKLYPPQD